MTISLMVLYVCGGVCTLHAIFYVIQYLCESVCDCVCAWLRLLKQTGLRV